MKLLKKKPLLFLCAFMLSVTFAFASGTAESSEGSGDADQLIENYLSRPLTIIVPHGGGGNMDNKARLIARFLSEEIGQSISVENKPGAGGVVGTSEYMAESGNTRKILYMAGSVPTVAPLYNDVPFSLNDFTPIIGVDTVEFGMFVNPSKSGISSFEELAEHGKNNIIKFGSSGPGSDTFLVPKTLLEMAGTSSETVTHKGSAAGLTNLLGGHIDTTYAAMNLARDYVEEGSLIPIIVFSEDSYTEYKDRTVATAKSYGFEIVYSAFTSFQYRNTVDPVIVNYMEDAIGKVYANSDFQDQIEKMGIVMLPLPSEDVSGMLDKINEAVIKFQQIIEK